MVLKLFEDIDSLSQFAAGHFVTIVGKAIDARGYSSVALSGGSTPRQMYSLLARNTQMNKSMWERVHLFWGDERNVPPGNPESNYLMAKQELLDHIPIPQENVHRIKSELPPTQAAADYEKELRIFFSSDAVPRFDLIFLGLGEDAHTASLFPGTDALKVKNAWVAANFVPKLDDWRITLTPTVINSAAQITFLVVGKRKAEGLRQVLQEAYQPDLYPAQIVRPAGGEPLWLVDREAATLIQNKA